MSQYYTKEVRCKSCGDNFKGRFMVGVTQPVSLECGSCREETRKKRIKEVLQSHPDVWYRPNSDDKQIAVYKPNGDRRYYKHEIHAIQRIENWYGDS